MRESVKHKKLKILIILISSVIIINIILFAGVFLAYSAVFSRCDYSEFDNEHFYLYEEIDQQKYKREVLEIPSNKNVLSAYLYGAENNLGLVIISPGHRDASDIKLPEIMYFVDNGWQVLCYDYTGCYGSTGKNMVGYVQAPEDLNAVLDYVEKDKRFLDLPVMLFGHSLGAYASTAVLQYEVHDITAVIAASGFDDPTEQWIYSVKRSTGFIGNMLTPYSNLLMKIKYGEKAHFSAIDGINSTDIPIMLLSGTDDEFYGDVSSIYVHKEKITNSNCTMLVMDEGNKHGHYNFFLSDSALDYRNSIKENNTSQQVDKQLYMEHDTELMDKLNDFYLDSLTNN